MTGLEKILEQINADAAQNSERIIGEAKEQAESLKKEAEAKNEAFLAAEREKQKTGAALVKNRGVSTAALLKRKMLLEAKQEIISETVAKAKMNLDSLADDEYFTIIEKMIKKYAHAGVGEILFNEKDKSRVPASFQSVLKSYQLSVSAKTGKFDGGFLLQYGEIEENCTFDALFAAAKEELQDKVRDLLFD